ncbi:MAG TPA: MBL fold metallo-hydrolase [Kineosporiaceae bacterium]|nr:MBL fold metallo-hydrolase [Kineosporiaceae bacterium]
MRLTWLGHSSVLVETEGVRVVADPLLRGRIGALRRIAAMPDAATQLLLTGADCVVVSHLHHDHCDLPSLRALAAPVLVVPPGGARWLASVGLPDAVELAPGETLDLASGVRIVATPAEHLGRREPWGPTAMSVGHLVESRTATAWLAGDTGLFAGMAGMVDLSRRGRIDVAAVPVWGWGPTLGPGHLDPELAAEAVARVGAPRAVPVHWGTLHPAFLSRAMRTQLDGPGPRFADALAALETPARADLLAVGEAVALG